MLAVSLRELHRTADIASGNMTASLRGCDPAALVADGPFADDRQVTDWFLARVDDEAGYLELAASRAEQALLLLPAPAGPADRRPRPVVRRQTPARETPARQTPAQDITRNVFVVHGRDEQARDAVFAFLRALDLRPLEWETLVAGTGSASPYLGDVIGHAVRRARAALVLMTPDDVVSLHPGLRTEHEVGAAGGLQARPNVLLELGMTLASYPDRTVIVKAGAQREVTDLGGRNFVQLDGGPACRRKIADRLRSAGCRVDDTGQDWLAPDLFAGLGAYTRGLPFPEVAPGGGAG